MNFLKKYWLLLVVLAVAGYAVWYYMDKKKKESVTAGNAPGTLDVPGESLADVSGAGYDGSGIAAGVTDIA